MPSRRARSSPVRRSRSTRRLVPDGASAARVYELDADPGTRGRGHGTGRRGRGTSGRTRVREVDGVPLVVRRAAHPRDGAAVLLRVRLHPGVLPLLRHRRRHRGHELAGVRHAQPRRALHSGDGAAAPRGGAHRRAPYPAPPAGRSASTAPAPGGGRLRVDGDRLRADRPRARLPRSAAGERGRMPRCSRLWPSRSEPGCPHTRRRPLGRWVQPA